MNGFVTFMASTTGRLLRVIVGLALMAWGWFGMDTTPGMVLILIGAVPFLAGVLDICLFAPLFGCPINGAKIRAGR